MFGADARCFFLPRPNIASECFLKMVTVKELECQLKSSIEDLKTFFKNELDIIKADFNSKLTEQASTINKLNSEVGELRGKVRKLESYIDEEDSYERRDTVILSGEALPTFIPGENCVEVLTKVLKDNLKIEISPQDINTVHRLGRKPEAGSSDTRSIICKFTRRDLKRNVYLEGRKLKRPSKLFVNESLSPKRSTIFRTLRRIKKERRDLVKGCTTVDGKVIAYTPAGASADGRDRRHVVNTYEALCRFCKDYIKLPVKNFLDSWNH